MHIPWEDLEIFVTVAEEQSFSAAARRLGLTQPTVSRRIAALEDRLERPLFRRDVEGAHLTEEGAKLTPAAIEMARFSKELERVASDFDDRPAGVVRIAVPPGTALEVIVPFARELQASLPEIQVHAICGVDYLDLSRGHAEIAIRARPPTQPDLMTVARARVEIGVFASQDYADRLLKKACSGALQPQDINWIAWSYPNEHLEPNPSLAKLIPHFKPVFASNDYNVQVRAVALGLGAMIQAKTRFDAQPYPPFVELPLALPLPPVDTYVICAKAMRWVPRVRAVLKELGSALDAIEGLTYEEVG
jgi:DNA-binding transcriptional LysR family regulator